MFDKLVVSSVQKRSRRTVRFFVCTSITYLCVVAAAFVLSIYLESPKLADSSDRGISMVTLAPQPPPLKRGQPQKDSGVSHRPDLSNVMKFEHLVDHHAAPSPLNRGTVLPTLGSIEGSIGGDDNGAPLGTGNTPGIIGNSGGSNDLLTKAPAPPAPTPHAVQADNKPLRISSTVLQGKVIERRVPIYPELARRIHLQADVAVEVIISPQGRVESVRAVSGHPMLTPAALDAARGWRFEPTLLNGVAVRVSGIITFVFKLND